MPNVYVKTTKKIGLIVLYEKKNTVFNFIGILTCSLEAVFFYNLFDLVLINIFISTFYKVFNFNVYVLIEWPAYRDKKGAKFYSVF